LKRRLRKNIAPKTNFYGTIFLLLAGVNQGNKNLTESATGSI